MYQYFSFKSKGNFILEGINIPVAPRLLLSVPRLTDYEVMYKENERILEFLPNEWIIFFMGILKIFYDSK